MSFVERAIEVTISLGEGQFGEDKGPDVTLREYRTRATFVASNGDYQGQLQLRIYGLPLAMINQLTSVGWVLSERRGKNRILVAAGDVGGVMTTVYEGQIDQVWGDFNAAPNAVLNIIALAAVVDAVKPVGALSFKGTVDVAEIMGGLAKTMGLAFENHDVQVKLTNPYFPGTAYDQVCACARQAGINFDIDRGILVIWPGRGHRNDDPIQVSPGTNMVGYPAFTGGGITFTTTFEPNFGLGKQVNVASELPVANGLWTIWTIAHQLESLVPGGVWFSQIQCVRSTDAQ